MSYVDQKTGPSPAGLASALVLQGAIGAVMITGLSVASGAVAPPEILDAWDIKDPPPPQPQPEPETKQQPEAAAEPEVTVPQPKFDFDRPQPDYKTSEVIVDRPIIPVPQPKVLPVPAPPAPVPAYDPVSAKPRNNPGAWLRDSDYRSTWVRRELAGVAGFKLDISATGRVVGCQLTRSTGHAELDDATCKLVQQRAKFEPARGPNGEPVSGSYSSAVSWVLPE